MKRKLEAAVPTSTWDDNSMRRAIAIAEKAEVPGRDGHEVDHGRRRSRATLYVAARSIADALGPDEEAIYFVLEEHYNPRCHPPWGDEDIGTAVGLTRWQRKARRGRR